MQNAALLTGENHQPHWLHGGDSLWPQSNCYVDLWIEILHSLALNPIASFAFTLATDFEGDQWTFFKVPLHDLFLLYGIDVQELNIWQSLLEQVHEQTSRKRIVLVEVDAFYLPDVADTSYHQEHVKTTIGIQALNPATHSLNYFHNSGYYRLHDTDFAGIFHSAENGSGEPALTPYTEFAKLDALKQRSEAELVELAAELMLTHLARRPTTNPFIAYSQHFQRYLASIQSQNLSSFHKYAFATMRQYGASFEYASLFLKWLADYQGNHLREAANNLEAISSNTQTLLLKTARAVRSKKPFDALTLLDTMAIQWEKAMEHIASHS